MHNICQKGMDLLLLQANFKESYANLSPKVPIFKFFIPKFNLKSWVPTLSFWKYSLPFWFPPPQIFFSGLPPFLNFQNLGSSPPFWKGGQTMSSSKFYTTKTLLTLSWFYHNLIIGQITYNTESTKNITEILSEILLHYNDFSFNIHSYNEWPHT